jgi:hypothetical protein
MKTLGVFHSTYYNAKAFQCSFRNFRNYFPEVPYLIYSDMGDDFHEYVDDKTFFKKADIRHYGTGPNSYWKDNWELWFSYYQRLKDACEICKTDYIMSMEDDVLITRSFTIEDDFNVCGPCHATLDPRIVQYLESYLGRPLYNRHYGLCGGAIFNAKKFLDNYDNILENLKNLHYEYSYNLEEGQGFVADSNFIIQFTLLGLDYSCSPWVLDGSIIHPHKNWS